MSVVLDLYTPGGSWLHRLDPRVKLWGVFVGSVMAFFLPQLLAQLLFLGILHVLLLSCGIPWRTLRGLWRQMTLLIVLIMILQPFSRPGGAMIFSLGTLQLTVAGLCYAGMVAARVMALALVCGGLLFTTDQPHLIRALVRLGIPYTWGITLSLTLRFLPAIQSLFIAVREAQAARGWTPRGSPLRRMREYLPILIAVVIGTLRLSDQLTLALAARGLTGHVQSALEPADVLSRTTWHDLRMQRGDWVAFGLITLIFIAGVGGQWLL
ncbi:MAG: energy-coupling factor transporter transmembrane protein EcfT [Anaerolineae bacterium]|nr:energy-coupling factor transporter transmembrane protein EcfT [Anaerolineae bacterium]